MDKTICSSDDGQLMLVLSHPINKFSNFFISQIAWIQNNCQTIAYTLVVFNFKTAKNITGMEEISFFLNCENEHGRKSLATKKNRCRKI